MFKANPSKSMSEHISGMSKGKSDKKKSFFGKKKEGKKGKFSLFKKKNEESDSDY